MAAERVVGPAAARLSVSLLTVAPVLALVAAVSLLAVRVAGPVSAAVVLVRLLVLPWRLSGLLPDLSTTRLVVSVIAAWRVLLVALLGGVVGDLLVAVMLAASSLLAPPALLAMVRGVGLVLLFVERFVAGAVVVSCHRTVSGL